MGVRPAVLSFTTSRVTEGDVLSTHSTSSVTLGNESTAGLSRLEHSHT